MRGFRVPHVTADAFLERVRSAMAAHQLDGMVEVAQRGDELVVTITRLGRSELRYRLSRDGDGFRAVMVRHRVAPLHVLYQQAFEDTLGELLRDVGATVTA